VLLSSSFNSIGSCPSWELLSLLLRDLVLALLGETCMGRQEGERAAVLGAALHVHELLSSIFGSCCSAALEAAVQ
jgi:hypothetical protein